MKAQYSMLAYRFSSQIAYIIYALRECPPKDIRENELGKKFYLFFLLIIFVRGHFQETGSSASFEE